MSITVTTTTVTPRYLRNKTKDEIIDVTMLFVEANVRNESKIEMLRGALEAVRTDHAYQRLSGYPHFTSAPSEYEDKQASAKRAWGLVEAALSKETP